MCSLLTVNYVSDHLRLAGSGIKGVEMVRNSRKLKQLERRMDRAEDYTEWREAAREHDEMSGQKRWREIDQSRQYDYVQIRLRLDRLRSLRARHDHHGLLYTLNEGIHGNMGGMGRSSLYRRAKFGTKQPDRAIYRRDRRFPAFPGGTGQRRDRRPGEAGLSSTGPTSASAAPR